MTRIVLNPGELAETASFLRSVSGEYEMIGTRVASCDCGCMPADVAATVDANVGAIRARLRETSGVLAGYASDLDRRASVPQDGSFTAVGSAFGTTVADGADHGRWLASEPGGSAFVVGGTGFDGFIAPAAGGSTVVVGGTGFDASLLGGGGSAGTTVVGGSGFDAFLAPATGGSTFVVGGAGFDPSFLGAAGAGGTMVVGGSGAYPSVGSGSGGGSFVVGGASGFDISALGTGGGGGTAVVGGASPQLLGAMQAFSASWDTLWSAAARDPVTMAALMNDILVPSTLGMNAIWAPGVM